jgi:DNA-binding NarL/FixJ family response regulator
MTNTIKVIVTGASPSRAALQEAITRVVPEARIAEAHSLAALENELLANQDADAVLVDSSLVDIQGFSALVRVCVRHPAIVIGITSTTERVAVVCSSLAADNSAAPARSARTAQIHALLHRLFDAGVSMLGQQIHASARNEAEHDPARDVCRLSPQQRRVLMSLASGMSNKIIAQDLGVTEATIKAHMTEILRKLGLERRTQAALLAQRILLTEP